MRIALFTDSFFPELGGIQDSILATSRALNDRGHTLLIVAPSASHRDFRLAQLAPDEIDLGHNVRIVRRPAIRIASSTGQSRLLLPTGRCWRALADFRPDIVHTHTFLGAGLEARRAATRLDLPLVGTNHWAVGAFAGYLPLPQNWVRRTSLKAVARFYNRCQLVTAPSQSVIDDLHEHGFARPYRVISNPIDTALFAPATPERRQALKADLGFTQATVIYAGRLAREKCIDVLIRALPALADRHPQAMLALAGHGSERENLQQLAGRLGVAERVRFLGTLDKPRLAQAFQAADLFALASTSETQSMVMLQAMSAGLPAVAADSLALPEYVDARCGRLAKPNDAADFARQLSALLDDDPLRRKLGEAAAQKTRRYAVDEIAQSWETLYAEAAHGRASPSFIQGSQQ